MNNSQSPNNTNKNDYIELQDKKIDDSRIHLTKEDNRKILPEEVKNLRFILSNYSQITKYTWENDGDKIIAGKGTERKVMFSREEKKILKYLLLQELPEKYRPKVCIYNMIYLR
jgi:hypothetical protein